MPQIPAGWKETTLGEMIDYIVDNRGKTPPITDIGYELLEVNAVSATSRIPDYSKVSKFISAETFHNWFRKGTLKKWDILVPTVGTIGNVAYSQNNRWAIAQNLVALRVNDESNSLFWYYLLKSPYVQKSLLNLDIGWVQPSIKVPHLLNLPIHLPPLPEQQAIAAVLSSFDDKIELLRAENQTLEQMGQELFKERFGKWKVGDELPAGWRVGKLGEIISLQWWFVHNINLAGWEKTKIAKMWVVDGKVFFNRNSVIWYPDIIPEKYKLEEWDLIICTRDVTQDRLVIWNVALVPDDLAKFWLYAWSNTWIVKTSFHKLFLFLLFRSRNFRNHIIQSAKGSTIVMITQDAFLYTNIIIPDQETLNQFDLVIKPLFNKIKQNSEQIQTLSATRDQLLPKLMSGEVRV